MDIFFNFSVNTESYILLLKIYTLILIEKFGEKSKKYDRTQIADTE